MWSYARTFRFGLGDNSNDSTTDAASSSTTGGHTPYEQWRDETYLNYINMRGRLRRQAAEQSQIRIPFISTEQLGHPWPRNDSWADRELMMMSQMQGYIQSIDQLSRELREAYEHTDQR
ncbi:hypothetical protein H4217_001423 [Coemansia sp. RSA 1939]|nr:hypothetical protein H4217_001423 [Coemansia sp. RSA 1939]